MGELLASIMAIIVVVVIGYFINLEACDTKARSFAQHEYHLIGGCMVVHQDRWLPLENIRGFDND